MDGQCLAGTLRLSSFHWLTAARVTPNAVAIAACEPMIPAATSIGCLSIGPSIGFLYRQSQAKVSPHGAGNLYARGMELGEWIRAARNRKGLAQAELADLLGRTKANISGWELGRHEPSFGQILRIAELTGHPIERVAWPLEMVDRERYYALSDKDRAYAQAKMMAAIEEREQAAPKEDEGHPAGGPVRVHFGGQTAQERHVRKRTRG